MTQAKPGVCRECGCTDVDCRQCIERTGVPCSWVPGEGRTLCTACAPAPPLAESEGKRRGIR